METSKKEDIQEGSDKVYIRIYKKILHHVVNRQINEGNTITISDLFFSVIRCVNQLGSSLQGTLLQDLEKDLAWDKLPDEQKKSKGDTLKKQLADPEKIAKYISVILEKANFIFGSLSLFGASLTSSSIGLNEIQPFYKISDTYKYLALEQNSFQSIDLIYLPLFFMMLKSMDDKLEYNGVYLTNEEMEEIDKYLITIFKSERAKLTLEEIEEIKESIREGEADVLPETDVAALVDLISDKRVRFLSESSHKTLRILAREIVIKCLDYKKDDTASLDEKIGVLSKDTLVRELSPIVFHSAIKVLTLSCEENDLKSIVAIFNKHFSDIFNKSKVTLEKLFAFEDILYEMVESGDGMIKAYESIVVNFRKSISVEPLLEAVTLSNRDRVGKLKYLCDLFFSAEVKEERHRVLVAFLGDSNLLQQNDIEVLKWYKNELDETSFIEGLHNSWIGKRQYGRGSYVEISDYEKIKLAFNLQEKNSKEELLKFVKDNTAVTANKFKQSELIFDLSVRTEREEDWMEALHNLLSSDSAERKEGSYAYSRFAAEAVIKGDLDRLKKFWKSTESVESSFKIMVQQRLLVDSTWAFHQALRGGKREFIDFFMAKVNSLHDKYNLLYGLDFYSSEESQQNPVFNAVVSRDMGVLNKLYEEMQPLYNALREMGAEDQEYSLIREVENMANKEEKKASVLTKLKNHIEKKGLSSLVYIPILYNDMDYLKQLNEINREEKRAEFIKAVNEATSKLGLPAISEEVLGIEKAVRLAKIPVVEEEQGPPSAKRAKQEWSGLSGREYVTLRKCLPDTSGYQPSGRSKRNAAGEDCEISWEDVDEINEEKEAPREFSKIKINSEKLLDRLRDPAVSGIKRAQLLNLADDALLTGEPKGKVEQLIKRHKTLMYLQKVRYVSGLTMYGMMGKNMLRDSLQGNWEGVAINLGFIGGGQGFARIAEVSSAKGMELLSNGKQLFGQSLRVASPFLARGTSAFIAYDLVNQVKAYKEGNPDAVVGIVGDSIYLGVDGLEVGIELAEVSGVLEGVSSVTGPVGAAVGAVVFIGTDVYSAVSQVNRIDALLHLTGTEKFAEGSRTFLGMKPEAYIEKLLEEKQGNNELYQQGIEFLKNHTDFQRYILPMVEAAEVCHTVKVVGIGRGTLGGMIADLISPPFEDKECSVIGLRISLNNLVNLDQKKKDIKWIRIKPDVEEGSLFCAPVGDDVVIPSEGMGYACENAMGVQYSDFRTGNITLIELGDGNDTLVSFLYGDHVVMLGGGYKNVTLGNGNDTFVLTGTPGPSSSLYGGGGINTLDLMGFARDERVVNVQLNQLATTNVVLSKQEKNSYVPYSIRIMGITRLLLRPHKQDILRIDCDAVRHVDGRGGESLSKFDNIIIGTGSHEEVSRYSLTLIVRPYTFIRNTRKGEFIYMVPNGGMGTAGVKIEGKNNTLHQFLFRYTLHDVSYLKRGSSLFIVGFRNNFSRDINNTALRSQFTLVIDSESGNSKHLYQLSDGTEIKVGEKGVYAFQSTNSSVEGIIKDYPRIAMRLNLFLFVQSSLSNESIAIGHRLHDVLSNDPYRRSHLVGNGGENIFVVRSGDGVLDKNQLPLPEVVLYDKDEQNLTDTLDLREIKVQLKRDLGIEIQVKTSLDNNDILLELVTSTLLRENLVSIRLKDGLLTNRHRRLHIILNHAPMVLDGLDLTPLPLEFGSDKAIIIISPDDVEENTKVIISKKLGDYHYYRLGDNLILSNALASNVTDRDRYAVSLQSFFGTPKLETLSIQFADKKLVLKSEVSEIQNAKDFVLECERYNQTLHEVLFNKNATKETMFIERRSSREIRHHERVDQGENKNVWERVSFYMLPLLGGVGAALGVGLLGYRNQMRRRLRGAEVMIAVANRAAIAVPLLVPTIEAKNEKSESGGGGHFIGDFSSNLVSNFSLLKYLLRPFRPSIVERMNEAERIANTGDSMDPLALVDRRVKKSLRKYDIISGTNTFEEMTAFQDKSATIKKSDPSSNVFRRSFSTTFFQPVFVSPSVSNDSCINDSRIEQPLLRLR